MFPRPNPSFDTRLTIDRICCLHNRFHCCISISSYLTRFPLERIFTFNLSTVLVYILYLPVNSRQHIERIVTRKTKNIHKIIDCIESRPVSGHS